jgi:hypothetical protein
MHTRLTLKPGQKGTRKLVAQYGDQLVCVRYRYDPQKKKRYKTVEIIVEEVSWAPALGPESLVQIRVAREEMAIIQRVKGAGGKWNVQQRVWEVRYDQVVRLGLEGRIVGKEGI